MLKNKQTKLIIISAFWVSLIFTPVNFDALIIPKLWIIVVLGFLFVPILVRNIRLFLFTRWQRLALIFSTLFVLQMIIVIIKSQAPIEQQLFGRTGRGLGFLLYFSCLILFLAMTIFTNSQTLHLLVKFLGLSGVLSSAYAIVQRLGIDIFSWDSRTNGIIGTLGNPNFQSSFAAMALVPALVYTFKLKFKYLWQILFLLTCLATIYFTQSTQGYVAIGAAITILVLYFVWFRSRSLFIALSSFSFLLGILSVLGMVNKGPFSYWFYKISVQSRGDFWRSGLSAIKDNLIFGSGLDSFGDIFLIYRDRVSIEMTDNAHNYFIEFGATGGLPLVIIYILITTITLLNFISVQKKIGQFDLSLVSIFCAWTIFQLQSVISPGSISLIFWNFIISGFIIGYNSTLENKSTHFEVKFTKLGKWLEFRIPFVMALIGFIIVFPLFRNDLLLKQGIRDRNANVLMQALTSYPQSSHKYNVFVQELFKSNLLPQALEMGRAAVKFNSNSVSAWAIIFVNPEAPIAERIEAKKQILRLDPLNTEVFKYKLD